MISLRFFSRSSLASKIIGSRVSRAGLSNILGLTGEDERPRRRSPEARRVREPDDRQHGRGRRALLRDGKRGSRGAHPDSDRSTRMGKYVLQFDPLDGSGNIDINASIGTIFSIHRRVTRRR